VSLFPNKIWLQTCLPVGRAHKRTTMDTKVVTKRTVNKSKMKLPDIYTIGVYGSSEKEFFQKLIDNNIDTFCDIRLRRAVRGSQYAFANSQRLQRKLTELSIQYLHEMGLAPTTEIIKLQDKFDNDHKIQRRKREALTDVFKTAYKDRILSKFDIRQFIKSLEKLGAKRVVLFCVEKLPNACHRSLVTDKIKELHPEIKIFHL
jgi:uncharacterized protein (DUF488 family)